jgi:hypothetical protein
MASNTKEKSLYAIGVLVEGDFVHINTMSKSKSAAIEMAKTLRIEAKKVRLVLEEDDDLSVVGGPGVVIGFVTDDYFQVICLGNSGDESVEIINTFKSQAQVRLAEVHENEQSDGHIHCGDHGHVPGILVEITDQVVWKQD